MTHNVVPLQTVMTTSASPAERLLLRMVDAGLAGCILVVPLLLGGRHPLGQLVLVSLAVTVALAWTARACLSQKTIWRVSGAEVILLAAVGLVVLQLVPLPERILHWLSPHLSEILPLWSADSQSPIQPGRWCRVSLTPAASSSGLAMLLAYAMLFWVTVQRIGRVEDVERLLRWCAWAAVGMATFGLVQLLAGNGKFFWFYEVPNNTTSDAAKGSFTNRNHFAQFLALGIGATIWWIQDSLRRVRVARSERSEGRGFSLGSLGLGVVLFAAALSLSRGGMVVMLLAGAIMILVCRRAKALGTRFAVALLAVAVVVATALAIHGSGRVGARLDDLLAGSVETLDAGARRRIIWVADLRAAVDFAPLGCGVGSHRWVCPMYLDPERLPECAALAGRTYFTHAENGPLQVAMETGLPGLLLLACGIGLVGYWCVAALGRASSNRALLATGAIVAALAASLVHSMVDFVWYIPGCTAIVAILTGALCRLYQITSDARGGRPWQRSGGRRVALVGVGLLLVVGGWMVADRVGPALAEPHWQTCRMLARASAVDEQQLAQGQVTPAMPVSPLGEDRLAGGLARRCRCAILMDSQRRASPPAKREHPAVSGCATTNPKAHPLEAPIKGIIAELEQVVRLNPTRAEARLQLAGTYLLLFECIEQRSATNAMPLSAIREAAISARFASRAELRAWLHRAVGEHAKYLDLAYEHTRRALRLCPLEGAGYLYLGQLSFLEGTGSRRATGDCVAQAVRLRPHDGGVLISAGQEAAIDGKLDRAIAYWQRAFRLGPVYRRTLVRRLAGKVCPEDPRADLDFFLDTFEPELATVRELESVYALLATGQQLDRLHDRHARLARAEAERCDEPAVASRLWMEARLAHLRRGRTAAAIDCLREAVRSDPNDPTARSRLAMSLMGQQQYDEAVEHLEWCLARKPEDRSLEIALRKCTKDRLRTCFEMGATAGLPSSARRISWEKTLLERPAVAPLEERQPFSKHVLKRREPAPATDRNTTQWH